MTLSACSRGLVFEWYGLVFVPEWKCGDSEIVREYV
jgi:hypothetical protein